MKIVLALVATTLLGGISAYELCAPLPIDNEPSPQALIDEVIAIDGVEAPPATLARAFLELMLTPLRNPKKPANELRFASRASPIYFLENEALTASVTELVASKDRGVFAGNLTVSSPQGFGQWERRVFTNTRTGEVTVVEGEEALAASEWRRRLRLSMIPGELFSLKTNRANNQQAFARIHEGQGD